MTLALFALLVGIYGADSYRCCSGWRCGRHCSSPDPPNFSRLDGGFAANIIISLAAMLIAAIARHALGIGMISQPALIRMPSVLVMNVLRNSPWLVVLYAMLYLLPFEVDAFGRVFEFSPMIKAIVGLSLAGNRERRRGVPRRGRGGAERPVGIGAVARLSAAADAALRRPAAGDRCS